MKKILIWDYEIPLKDSGGPSGYLNNIYSHLQIYHSSHGIYFLSDLIESPEPSLNGNIKSQARHKSIKTNVSRLIPHKLKKVVQLFKHISSWKPCDCLPKLRHPFEYKDFDIIHFHFSYHLYIFNNILRKGNFSGLFLLTTHCPQPLSHELIDVLSPFGWLSNYFRPKLEKKERLAWEYADYFVFPVPDAINVYKSNKQLKDFIENNTSKFRFCPTGISENFPRKGIDIRKSLNIPEDAFIVSYIGRHNEIKGYSELKIIGENVLNINKNIFFVVAGKEEPIKGLKHERWIELGWINFGNELMEQSDLFILPNKDTYFDLIALEALRVGVPILMTSTGGNRYFEKKFKTSGLLFYPYGNNTMAEEMILEVYKKKYTHGLNSIRNENRDLYSKCFTTKTFLSNYLKICNSIE